MECGQYRELLVQSLKVQVVEYLLQSNNIEYIKNKKVCSYGSLHCPDFIIPTVVGYIVVVVDFSSKQQIEGRNSHEKNIS